jgi:hypothetical protein
MVLTWTGIGEGPVDTPATLSLGSLSGNDEPHAVLETVFTRIGSSLQRDVSSLQRVTAARRQLTPTGRQLAARRRGAATTK